MANYLRKYDTKQLRTRVHQKGLSHSEFLQQVMDLTGTNKATLSNYFYGTSTITDEAITAFSIILGITDEQIKNMIQPIDKTAETVKKQDRPKNTKPSKKSETKSDKAKTVPEKQETLKQQPKQDPLPILPDTDAKITEINGIADVFEVFKIVVKNQQTILNSINDQTAVNILNEKLNLIISKLDELDGRISSLEIKQDSTKKLPQTETKTDPIFVPKYKIQGKRKIASIKPDNNETPVKKDIPEVTETLKYNPNDDFSTYARKINAMIKKIADMEDKKENEIKHVTYTEMNREYGVVWDQLKKEYREKNDQGTQYALALIHFNKTFAEIYFNKLYSRAMGKPENAEVKD